MAERGHHLGARGDECVHGWPGGHIGAASPKKHRTPLYAPGHMTRTLAVVGGGITGLAAAHRATTLGDIAVTVFERSDAVGGRIRTSPFAGVDNVDEGADAFLARVPDATDLSADVGLGDSLVHPEPVGAAVWQQQLHDIPDGLLLGVPGRMLPLARTGLLSWRGKLRAGLEPLLPRTSIEPDSIGLYVRARFGDEVHDRLVDALVGSIYATDTDHFSLAEVPQLHALASTNRSLLLAARKNRAASGTATAAAAPIFAAPRAGIGELTRSTASAVVDGGGTVRTNTTVTAVERSGSGWSINGEHFDAVVFATPAAASAPLLSEVAPEAAGLLEQAETADVILATLHIGADEWPERLRGRSGYLVPKPVQRTITAVSFGSQKWAHWRPPAGGEILRVSLGRDGQPVLHLSDDEVIIRILDDLHSHLGARFSPLDVRLSRWPGAFAQYRPHHAAWADRVDAELPAGIFVAGASYRGIGIPACIRQGRAAADRSADHIRHLAD